MNVQSALKAQSVAAILDDLDADEAWRPALITFYRNDEMPTRAAMLEWGDPLAFTDRRTIAALIEARKVMP